MVRLLGQRFHYPKAEVWRNEATFSPAAGGACGVMMEPDEGGDEANISLYFDEGTIEVEQRKFADMVREHFKPFVDEKELSISGTLEIRSNSEDAANRGSIEPPPTSTIDTVEVFLSWRQETEGRTSENVRTIARMLQDHGIRTFGEFVASLGTTSQEELARIKGSRVALILLAGRPSRDQLSEYQILSTVGCRFIPVILPNASPKFVKPKEFKDWRHVDCRGKFGDVDVDKLANDIVEAWKKGPLTRAHLQGHVFVSYFREDIRQVSELVTELQSAGHVVWWDRGAERLPPGTVWDQEIRDAIRDSYAFILCVSSLARSKSWVYQEISRAIEIQRTLSLERIFIIPVRLSDCEVPNSPIDASRSLGQLQHFDYFGRNRNVSKLVAVLDKARLKASE